MAVPREGTSWTERVEVAAETSVGSGTFVVDDRLRTDMVALLSDAGVGTAHIAVRIGGGFTSADAAARYYSDKRIVVRAGGSVLFDGYPNVGRVEWGRGRKLSSTGRRGIRRDQEFGLDLEHVVGRLGRDVRGQIIGRYVRDGVIADGLAVDPDAWCSASVLARGLPCIFNMDGVGNCDPVPIQVADGDGGTREVHIFADDSRADAVPWTYAKVLRYLLHCYVWPDCPVRTRDVFDQTDAASVLSGEGREAVRVSDPLSYALLAQPDTLVLEATSLLEAWALVSAASSLHLTAESVPVGRGVRTAWRVWSELDGPARELYLATDARDEEGRPVYDPTTVAVIDLFEDNNVSASSMCWDARRIGETALVLGGVKCYEVQMELLPGWLPEADLDNVAEGPRAAAKAMALVDEQILALGAAAGDDAWYRAYHGNGDDFAAHWEVARLWVLNEAGTYNASQYNRNAPFDAYAPCDFSAVSSGRWMRRDRRLLPIAMTPGGPRRVWLEASFDGGQNWSLIDSGYHVLSGECGIWFSVPNLLSISPTGGGTETNLWYALIDQTCRVRVTALIESDERLAAEASGRSAPTLFRNATVLYSPERFRFLRRLDGSDGGAEPANADSSTDRDDSDLMAGVAEALAAQRGSRAVTATPIIPWLDTSYEVGDRIVGVRGRGIRFSAERVPSRRHACVVGKRYRFDSGRFETELILTSTNGADAAGLQGA